MAVVFAMLASYGLSRTLTPITIGLLLKNERHGAEAGQGWFARLHGRFEHVSSACGRGYRACSRCCYDGVDRPGHRHRGAGARRDAVRLCRARFLPRHRRRPDPAARAAPAGTRIEKTEQIFQAIEDKIREVIPADEREMIVDNIGLPARTYN